MAVHDDDVELVLGGQFGSRGGQPAVHHLGRLGAAAGQPALQRLPARGRQKDRERLGHRRLDGSRAGQIDLDEHRMARRGGVADGFGGRARAVQAAVDLGPLEQGAVVDQLLEALGGDERVVDAVDLTGPRAPWWSRRR